MKVTQHCTFHKIFQLSQVREQDNLKNNSSPLSHLVHVPEELLQLAGLLQLPPPRHLGLLELVTSAAQRLQALRDHAAVVVLVGNQLRAEPFRLLDTSGLGVEHLLERLVLVEQSLNARQRVLGTITVQCDLRCKYSRDSTSRNKVSFLLIAELHTASWIVRIYRYNESEF